MWLTACPVGPETERDVARTLFALPSPQSRHALTARLSCYDRTTTTAVLRSLGMNPDGGASCLTKPSYRSTSDTRHPAGRPGREHPDDRACRDQHG